MEINRQMHRYIINKRSINMNQAFHHPLKDLEKKRALFFRIGLLISLFITFVAFEWRTETPTATFINDSTEWEPETMEWLPVIKTAAVNDNRHKPEHKHLLTPVVQPTDPVVVPDDHPADSDTLTGEVIPIDPRPEPDPGPEPMLIAEIMPQFPGGDAALLKFLTNNIRFPETARKEGVSGVVHMKFVIDENGNIINISCLRSPAEVLTEEAVRVLRMMPKWLPGIQSGKKVSVTMTLPVHFRLL
jgi:periplasmic protein TonB